MFHSTVMVMSEMLNHMLPKYEGKLFDLSKFNPNNWFIQKSYGQQLDEYITRHNPTTVFEVERLADEFDRTLRK